MIEQEIIYTILKEIGCDGILITDGNGKIVCIGEEFFRETLGIRENELIGQSVFDLEKTGIINPPLAVKVIEEGRPVTLVSEVKGVFDIVGEAFPLFGENGEIKWIVSFTRNVISNNKIFQLYDDILERYNQEHNTLLVNDNDEQISHTIIEGFYTFNRSFTCVLKAIERIAQYDATILLTGGTGTGKTMLAKKIHKISGRKGDFIEVNCGAMPENLIESELFGYEAGAFTGAEKGGKQGLFEAAKGGTLFLDEISELPMSSQVKLLAVLQDKNIRRVGSTKNVEVDCRIIAATNKNLEDEANACKFRKDLFYRLNIASFFIPNLKERYEDIIPLAKSLLRSLGLKYNRELVFDYEVLSLFMQYPWPGNVRELENTIHRMVLMADQNVLRKDLLPNSFMEILNATKSKNPDISYYNHNYSLDMDLKMILATVEGSVIQNTWEKCHSSIKVANALKISQTSAARKIKKYVKNLR